MAASTTSLILHNLILTWQTYMIYILLHDSFQILILLNPQIKGVTEGFVDWKYVYEFQVIVALCFM